MIFTMLDTAFTVLCTGALSWAMYSAGRRAEARTVPPPPKPLEAVCSCGHGYGKHPGNGEHCGGTTLVRRKWTKAAGHYDTVEHYADEVLECGCTSYDGPDPETVRMIRERDMADRCDECGRRIRHLDVTMRWVPRHVWVRLVFSTTIEPGHKWMYARIVRRDTFSVRGWGLVVLRMPETEMTRRAIERGRERRS